MAKLILITCSLIVIICKYNTFNLLINLMTTVPLSQLWSKLIVLAMELRIRVFDVQNRIRTFFASNVTTNVRTTSSVEPEMAHHQMPSVVRLSVAEIVALNRKSQPIVATIASPTKTIGVHHKKDFNASSVTTDVNLIPIVNHRKVNHPLVVVVPFVVQRKDAEISVKLQLLAKLLKSSINKTVTALSELKVMTNFCNS